MRGYKARRIYNNNKNIKKYRHEFRDLIQFAYTLKQEMNGQEGIELEQTKSMLLTSLKDLIAKREQFCSYFQRLLGDSKLWLQESQPRLVQGTKTAEARGKRASQQFKHFMTSTQQSVGKRTIESDSIHLSEKPKKKAAVVEPVRRPATITRSFLRRGEKSKQRFDHLKSIEREKVIKSPPAASHQESVINDLAANRSTEKSLESKNKFQSKIPRLSASKSQKKDLASLNERMRKMNSDYVTNELKQSPKKQHVSIREFG